jgi:methyl-accepting chemotaxis protein
MIGRRALATCLSLAVSAAVPAFAAAPDTPAGSGSRRILAEWRWEAGDDPARADPSFDDSSWEALALPASVRPGEPGEVFWLRARVSGSSEIPGAARETEQARAASAPGVWFLSGKAGVAFELYANGVYVGSRGSLPPDFDLRTTQASAIHIPASLADSGELTLALRCSYRGTEAPLPAYALGDAIAADFDLGVVNFWNGRLFLVLASLSAFLGLYFLVLFFLRAEDRYNLYYFLTLAFIAVYFFEIGATSPVSGGIWFRAVARACLLLSMAFLVPFVASFFDIAQRRAYPAIPVAIGALFMAAFVVFARDESAMSTIFTLSLLPITAAILFSFGVAFRAMREGKAEAWPVLAGIAVGIGLSAHDVVYQVAGKEPFAWLQGIAFFCLNIGVFIALSMRQTGASRNLERYAHEIERKTEELKRYLGRLEEAGSAAAALARELDGAASAAAASVESAAAKSRHIGEDIERQAEAAQEADGLVADFVASIGRINGSLEEQSESVQSTAVAAGQLSAGADSVAENISGTTAFAGGLAERTGSGERSAAALDQAMKRISEASEGIEEVVAAVEEFAERTNILAINAAIEAAHAGATGRGFAIIASEVKKLASAQAERAARIRDIVADIGERVGEGSREAQLVRSALRSIAAEAAEAVGRLAQINDGTAEQRRASAQISEAMEALASTGVSIKEEAKRQAGYSEEVRGAVASIAAEAAEVRSSAKEIAEGSAELVSSVLRLRELAARTRELTSSLASARVEGGAREG